MLKIKLYISVILCLFLTSCVKKELIDTLPPTQIKVAINWSKISGLNNQDSAILHILDRDIKIAVGEQPKPDSFAVESGFISAHMYSISNGITVNDGLASVTTDINGYIKPNPDLFYSANIDANAELWKTTNIEITPEYCMRTLNIKFDMPDSVHKDTTIRHVLFTLNNVAQSFEINAKKESNAGLSTFSMRNFAIQNSCACNYLGFTGNTQILSIEMLLNFDVKRIVNIDISHLLSDFNTNKSQPKTITIDWDMVKDQWYNFIW